MEGERRGGQPLPPVLGQAYPGCSANRLPWRKDGTMQRALLICGVLAVATLCLGMSCESGTATDGGTSERTADAGLPDEGRAADLVPEPAVGGDPVGPEEGARVAEVRVEEPPGDDTLQAEDTLSDTEFDQLDSEPVDSTIGTEFAGPVEEDELELAPRRSNAIIFVGYIILAMAALGVITYFIFRLLEGPAAPPLRASRVFHFAAFLPFLPARPFRRRRRR